MEYHGIKFKIEKLNNGSHKVTGPGVSATTLDLLYLSARSSGVSRQQYAEAHKISPKTLERKVEIMQDRISRVTGKRPSLVELAVAAQKIGMLDLQAISLIPYAYEQNLKDEHKYGFRASEIELSIIELMAAGKTVENIAYIFGIPKKRVERIISSIKSKNKIPLDGSRSTVSLVVTAMKAGAIN